MFELKTCKTFVLAAATSEEDGGVEEADEGWAMGRRRGTPVGRRRPLRDPQHHHVLRPVHGVNQRGVRQGRPGRPRRAARRRRRQPHDSGTFTFTTVSLSVTVTHTAELGF